MPNINMNSRQELREIGEAASTLASFKHTKFYAKTLSTLEKLKKRHKKIQKTKNPSPRKLLNLFQDQELPRYPRDFGTEEIMKLIEAYTPPLIPPMESLGGVVGECSKPFEKQLTGSDVKDDLNRLYINKGDLEKFLMPMLNMNEDLEKGIPVDVYDTKGKKFKMVCKIWSFSRQCVLTDGWTAFSHEHNLIGLQDFVTIWMFRHRKTVKLCFVLSSRRLPVFQLLKRKRTAPDKELCLDSVLAPPAHD